MLSRARVCGRTSQPARYEDTKIRRYEATKIRVADQRTCLRTLVLNRHLPEHLRIDSVMIARQVTPCLPALPGKRLKRRFASAEAAESGRQNSGVNIGGNSGGERNERNETGGRLKKLVLVGG